MMALFAVLQSAPVAGGVSVQTGIMALVAVAVLALLLTALISRYKRVPPDQALVVFGGGRSRVVSGGATIVWPVVNECYWMDLRAFQINLHLENAPNKDRIPVTLKAMATCRISKEEGLLRKAAENFGRSTPKEIQEKVGNVLEGHLRVVIGQIEMDTILSKRDEFNQKIQNEAATELKNLGVDVVILNILEVSDPNGVIEALGKPMVAKIKAEAAIQEADQLRRQTIETTNAQREAETTRAQNETKIAEARRGRDIQVAQYDADVARQRSTSEQAGPLASAEARKGVVKAEVEVEAQQTQAQIALQDAVRQRNEAALKATTITTANAERERTIIEAEGRAKARTTQADAEKMALQAEGEGKGAQTRAVGLAEAEVTQSKGLAQAEVTKQTGLAQAEAEKAQLLAKAAGTQAELTAEAAGRKALIEAYADLSPEQRQLFVIVNILDRMPAITAALGDAGQKIMQPIAESMTAALANIDSMTVIDSPSGDGKGAISRLTGFGPDSLFMIFQRLQAAGVLPALQGLLQKAGVDVGSIMAAATEATSGRRAEDNEPPIVAEVVNSPATRPKS